MYMYMFVMVRYFMYACMSAHMCISTFCVCAYVGMHIPMCVCMYICKVSRLTCVHTLVYMCACMCAYIHE